MRTERLDEIERRADSYEQMEEIPAEVACHIPAHYLRDVPALLLEIQRLENRDKMNTSIMNGKDKTIDNLQKDMQAMRKRMREVAEKHDLNKDVFSPPREPSVGDFNKKRPTQLTVNNIPE